MNFEQWLVKSDNPYDSKYRDIGLARDSWNACKDEILQIIESVCEKDGYEGFYEIQEKIENL